jgi:hypothetical protein
MEPTAASVRSCLAPASASGYSERGSGASLCHRRPASSLWIITHTAWQSPSRAQSRAQLGTTLRPENDCRERGRSRAGLSAGHSVRLSHPIAFQVLAHPFPLQCSPCGILSLGHAWLSSPSPPAPLSTGKRAQVTGSAGRLGGSDHGCSRSGNVTEDRERYRPIGR